MVDRVGECTDLTFPAESGEETLSLGALTADLLRAGHLVRFEASGTSMLPLVHSGATIEIEPVATNALRTGDLVFCLVPDSNNIPQVLIHRLLKTQLPHLTRGDNCIQPDRTGEVLGRVVTLTQNGQPLNFRRWQWRIVNRWLGLVSRWQWQLTQLTIKHPALWPVRKASTLLQRVSLKLVAFFLKTNH